MIYIPTDLGPERELAIRRAWDFSLAQLTAYKARPSAVKLFAVVFQLRHHLIRGNRRDTIEGVGAQAGISPRSARTAWAWLVRSRFVFAGRGAGGRLRSSLMLNKDYLCRFGEVFESDYHREKLSTTYPQWTGTRQAVAGSDAIKTNPCASRKDLTVGSKSDRTDFKSISNGHVNGTTTRTAPAKRLEDGPRMRAFQSPITGADLARAFLGSLSPPGSSAGECPRPVASG